MLDAIRTPATATESDASNAAISGTFFDRFKIGAQAMFALLRDPDDIEQVFLLGIVANSAEFPRFLAKFASTAQGEALLADKPAIDGKVVARLRLLPEGTLGGAYARYLDENNLDADLFTAPPGLPQPAAYVAQRIRQTHDIWHVLTGYDPNVPGEIALQGFTYGQTWMPSAALIASLGTLRWMRKNPRVAKMAIDGYRRGRDATFLSSVRWEDHFDRPLEDVRHDFGVRGAAIDAA
jgi:ubiquinone biosynthesis protein COQ4